MNIERMSYPEMKAIRVLHRVIGQLVTMKSKDMDAAADAVNLEEEFSDAIDQLHHMNAHIEEWLKDRAKKSV